MNLKSLREFRTKQKPQYISSYVETDNPNNWKFVTTEQLITATKKLIPQLPTNISGIAGVPRSGMIPAACLATWLHLPLYEVTRTGIRSITNGSRAQEIKTDDSYPIVIIDDTVHSGESLQKIKNRTTNAFYTAVFVTPDKQGTVDFFSELLPSPHLLEWNLFNSGIISQWALDFDGVICEDCPCDGKDTERTNEIYRKWILSAKPKWLTRLVTVPLVITARLESYREDTVKWCSQWGIKIDRLEMHPAQTFKERNESNIAEWKASVLQKTNYLGYVDSHSDQAEQIYKIWDKPTVSLQNAKVYQ